MEVSLNEEKDAKPKARRIDPNVRYEHFTFLGHFKDEEAEPNVKELVLAFNYYIIIENKGFFRTSIFRKRNFVSSC